MPPERYRIIRFEQQVGSGVSQAWWAAVSAVVKTNTPTDAPYCVPNELICGHLGRFLGLPIPPCGLLSRRDNPTQPYFGTLNFNLDGDSLPPVDPAECASLLPDLSAGVLVFDIWVANGDRHEANLALDISSSPPQLSVFDHSHALFGRHLGQVQPRFDTLRDVLGIADGTDPTGNRHCLLDAVTTDVHFPKWLDRIRLVPEYVIDDACRSAIGSGIKPDEAWAGVQFLKYRQARLRDIITSHRDRFTAIRGWSSV
jgi:hypothetical protein